MKSILVELMCRQCMYHTYRKSETLILSDFETQAREDLLNDSYFTMRCPTCGNLIEFIHPLAYVDTKHKFILLIKSKKDFNKNDYDLYSEDQTSRKRFLYNHSLIGEKIKILEDGFDDRAIEILKVQVQRKYEKQKKKCTVSYHDVDARTNTLWFILHSTDTSEYIAVLLDSYTKIVELLPEEFPTRFNEIDEVWAHRFISERKVL